MAAQSTVKRANLLVELLVEELPPKVLDAMGAAFGRVLAQELFNQGLVADALAFTPFASPRRLAVHVRDVATRAIDGFFCSGDRASDLSDSTRQAGAKRDQPICFCTSSSASWHHGLSSASSTSARYDRIRSRCWATRAGSFAARAA